MGDICEDSSLISPILTLPSPLCLYSKSALTKAFTQTNGQVVAVHSTATALAMAYIFGPESRKYANNLLISNNGVIRLLIIEVGEEFTSASIVEVGSVMPATVVETISCTYDDTFENDNRKKIPEVETGLEQEQRISSALSPATAERLEVDFERLSARSLVVDVIGCVGDCYLGLRNADEACLAAWMKIGSGSCSDSDHANSIRNFLPTEVPLVWGGYCTSLDEQSKKACLREMEIFRRADADDAFRESKNSWTGDRADAESVLVHDSKEVFSTVYADAAESSFPVTVSVLCNRLLHILRASGINLIFSPSSHKNTVQISPHNSSKIDHEIREQTAAKAAMLVALSSYGQYEDPKLNIGIQILKFVKIALSQARQADEEVSLLRLSPLPESGHSINSVLVWSASPCKAIPSSSTIPLCVQEKVTDDETADSDSREMGEEQSWHSAGGALMTMVLRLVSIELGVSLHSGSCGEEAKVEVDTPVTNCVNMINGISDDQKERTNDDSLRTLLFDDSSPGVASVSTQKLSPSTPSLPPSPSLLPSPPPSLLPSLLPSLPPSPSLLSSNSLSPPAVQVCIMPPDSIFEGSKELSAHYDFRYLMTSAVQTSTVVRVYECINLNSTFGLCLRCITHQGGGMVGEKGINTHNLVGMHRDDNAPFRHSMVRHSNIVRMDRVRSGYSNGEQFRVVLQGLPSHSTEELGTCSNIGMIVMTSTAFEETYVNGGNSLLESEEEEEIELRRNRKIEFTKAVYIGQNVGSMSITFPSAVDSPDASYCEWAVLIVEQRECNERLCTDPATPDEMDPNYAILGTIPLNECPSDVCMISLMREREGGLYSVKADYLHPLVIPPMSKVLLPHSMSKSDSGAFRRQSDSLENSGEEFDRRGEQCKLSSPHSPRIAVIPSESYMQFDPSDVAYATQNPCRVALILAFLCCRIAVKTILYCTILFLATKVPYIFIAPEGVHTGLWQAYLSQKSEGGALLSPTVTSNVTAVSSDVPSYLSGKILSQLSSNTWMKGEGKYIEIADVEIKRIGVEEDVAVEILMEMAIVADDNGKEVESFISSLTPSPILTVGCSVNLNTKTVSERVNSLVRTFLLPVYLMLRVMLQGFFKLLNDGWRSMTRGTERRANSM